MIYGWPFGAAASPSRGARAASPAQTPAQARERNAMPLTPVPPNFTTAGISAASNNYNLK